MALSIFKFNAKTRDNSSDLAAMVKVSNASKIGPNLLR